MFKELIFWEQQQCVFFHRPLWIIDMWKAIYNDSYYKKMMVYHVSELKLAISLQELMQHKHCHTSKGLEMLLF